MNIEIQAPTSYAANSYVTDSYMADAVSSGMNVATQTFQSGAYALHSGSMQGLHLSGADTALPFSLGLDITLVFLTVLYIVHLLMQVRSRAGEPLFARIDSSFLQARKRCLVDQKVSSRS